MDTIIATKDTQTPRPSFDPVFMVNSSKNVIARRSNNQFNLSNLTTLPTQPPWVALVV